LRSGCEGRDSTRRRRRSGETDRSWRLEWGKDGGASVDSVETLDRLLDDLDEQARERPFMVELISPTAPPSITPWPLDA
jgi:hypothetical protein